MLRLRKTQRGLGGFGGIWWGNPMRISRNPMNFPWKWWEITIFPMKMMGTCGKDILFGWECRGFFYAMGEAWSYFMGFGGGLIMGLNGNLIHNDNLIHLDLVWWWWVRLETRLFYLNSGQWCRVLRREQGGGVFRGPGCPGQFFF